MHDPEGGSFQLYTVNLDGSNLKQITTEAEWGITHLCFFLCFFSTLQFRRVQRISHVKLFFFFCWCYIPNLEIGLEVLIR
jgi:hypothetical protein